MTKIKSKEEFREAVDAAFETKKTRDEAKACYEFTKEEFAEKEERLCAYAAANKDLFPDESTKSATGATDNVEYAFTRGVRIERANGKKVDEDFLKSIPRKYVRVSIELNKSKIVADKLSDEKLASLGLVRVKTMCMKLKAKAKVDEV